MSQHEFLDVESIRKRPVMYLGTLKFFGLVHYLVHAVGLNLADKPTYLALANTGGTFTIESDAELHLEQDSDGTIFSFERFREVETGRFDGLVVNALSSSLSVDAVSRGRRWSIEYRKGCRTSLKCHPADGAKTWSRIAFIPDASLFEIESISPYNFHSYLKRISFLNPGVRFTATIDGRQEEFYSANGLRDMFECIAIPYQLLHEPIQFRVSEDDLDLEVIFAFHSWKDDVCWSFINKGRTVQGGTHEEGLAAGLRTFRSELAQRGRGYELYNGILGLMSLHTRNVVWEGCIKARIGDPNLADAVERLVSTNALKWIDTHPGVAAQIQEIQTFQFPDVWGTT